MTLRIMRWPADASRIRDELSGWRAADVWKSRREMVRAVEDICAAVASGGDRELLDYVRQFDGAAFDSGADLVVSDDEMKRAAKAVPRAVQEALRDMAGSVESFHRKQLERLGDWEDSSGGNTRGELLRPVDRVGVYVPGGKARYPSSVLMGVLPARVAGVGKVVMASPPGSDGEIAPEVLFAAGLVDVDRVYKMGGAHAVAALAFGTETVGMGRGVDKIVGPGGQYVTVAKHVVSVAVGIDSLAGPSELMVLADESARAEAVAWDLMGQAEHGEDSACILVTSAPGLADEVNSRISEALKSSRRAALTAGSLGGMQSAAVIVERFDAETIDALVNERAPEHLEIVLKDREPVLAMVRHAGCILVGPDSPCALGDYGAGPNHVIPTAGAARFSSPLGVSDFLTRSSIIRWSEAGLREAAPGIETLGQVEGLEAHARAAKSRGISRG